MRYNGKLNPFHLNRWLLLDREGEVHARILRCSRGRAAEIARVMFPEISGFRIVNWHVATDQQRRAAGVAAMPELTKEVLEGLGYVLSEDSPVQPPPPAQRPHQVQRPVEHWAKQLTQRFPRTRGAGGGAC